MIKQRKSRKTNREAKEKWKKTVPERGANERKTRKKNNRVKWANKAWKKGATPQND
jgi:hypothetical protein